MSTTTKQPAPDFGEPWKIRGEHERIVIIKPGALGAEFDLQEHALRAIACVNACAGISDPVAEIQAMREAIKALRRLRWIPVSERLPTEDDANDSHDVEWSNSGDIWQAHFTDSERATHWRPITLP